jgi:LPS-assembly lipoprotein
MGVRYSISARSRISALLLGLTCSALTGCGFNSLYGDTEGTQFDETLAAVQVNPISERMGQRIANSLRDALNPTNQRIAKRYTLTVTLTTSNGDVAVRKDGTASRELEVVFATFQLFEGKSSSSVLLLSGSTRSQSSYEIGESPYSVIVANANAQTRAAQDISAEIRDRLLIYFRRQTTTS